MGKANATFYVPSESSYGHHQIASCCIAVVLERAQAIVMMPFTALRIRSTTKIVPSTIKNKIVQCKRLISFCDLFYKLQVRNRYDTNIEG